MNYTEQLNKMIQRISAIEGMDVTREDIGSPGDEFIMQAVMKAYGIKQIPAELEKLYDELSSCRIEWTYDLDKNKSIQKFHEGDESVNGIVRIRPAEAFLSFDEKLSAAYWTEQLEPEERNDLEKFRYFDMNDDYIRVGCFITAENKIDDSLYFLTQEATGFSAAQLSLAAYLEKMFYYNGFQGWSYNYFFQESANYKRMIHYLNQIFKMSL